MTRVIIIGAIAVVAIIRVSMRMRKRRRQADQAAMVAGEEAESAGDATTFGPRADWLPRRRPATERPTSGLASATSASSPCVRSPNGCAAASSEWGR